MNLEIIQQLLLNIQNKLGICPDYLKAIIILIEENKHTKLSKLRKLKILNKLRNANH